MTDAHCHFAADSTTRHFICLDSTDDFSAAGESAALLPNLYFFGIHPWQTLNCLAPDDFISKRLEPFLAALEHQFTTACGPAGIGEIGLDRLKCREVSPLMREVFIRQLALAAHFHKPVILHGAKCWGQVVAACKPYAGQIPRFLFHGFSRSDGLIPDIIQLNGYISVGSAILNDHAVNYQKLVTKIPLNRLLVETDSTRETAANLPRIDDIVTRLARLRGMSLEDLNSTLERNANEWYQ